MRCSGARRRRCSICRQAEYDSDLPGLGADDGIAYEEPGELIFRAIPSRWLHHGDYNHQPHWAHREREDGRRAPLEVLGASWSAFRHREELRRAFFSARFLRVLDSFGYARFGNWRPYGEEALAGPEAALRPSSLAA